MTDFHCIFCHRRVRVYHHEDAVTCGACGRPMQRGRGKRTTLDAWHPQKRRPRDDEAPERMPR